MEIIGIVLIIFDYKKSEKGESDGGLVFIGLILAFVGFLNGWNYLTDGLFPLS